MGRQAVSAGRLTYERGARVTDAEGWQPGLAAGLTVVHNREQVPA